MKWVKWLWPIVALTGLAVYYVVGAFATIPIRFIDHRRFVWPGGTLGIVFQFIAYGTIIAIAVGVAGGAIVAVFLYIRQNKPPRQSSI